jgi:hypothetical protein
MFRLGKHRMFKEDPKTPRPSFEEEALYNMLLVKSLIELLREKSVPGGNEKKQQTKRHQ